MKTLIDVVFSPCLGLLVSVISYFMLDDIGFFNNLSSNTSAAYIALICAVSMFLAYFVQFIFWGFMGGCDE